MQARSKLSGRLACMLVGLCALAAGCGGGNGSGSGNGATLSPDALGAGRSHPFLHAAPGAAVCNGADLSGVRTAIYVSPQGTLDPNCGTTTAATCKSVRQGIARCTGDGCAVLVRHGLYTEPDTIEIKNGVSVYGGCRFGGEPDRKYRTTIQAAPGAGSPMIAAAAIQSATTVHGLVIVGTDESAGGSPSIAMTVSGSRGLVLTGSVLAAGRGGDGATGASANGQPGGPGFAPACATCRGMPGAACPSNPPAVGVGGGGAGAASNVYRSHACAARCLCDPVNVADSTGLNGEGSGAVSGGTGAKAGAVGCSCWNAETLGDPGLEDPGTGNTGGTAQPGVCSTQGGIASTLVWGARAQGAVWVPSTGGTGAPGMVGAGGGGGGAGGFSTDNGTDRDGMPGGGGGGGGCGGPGGSGGPPGGASIALLLVDSDIAQVASVNSLVPGPAGRGGTGGAGGLGGPGGSGGPGMIGGQSNFDVWGTCHVSFAPASGGPGGPGGAGGAGSGGAGGNGGPSIGIALRGASPLPGSSSGIYPGTAGAAGGRGAGGVNPNCSGVAGSLGMAGAAAPIVNLDQGAAIGAR